MVNEYGNKMYNLQNLNKIEQLAFLISIKFICSFFNLFLLNSIFKLKEIQTTDHDEKILLWLLTPPMERIVLIFKLNFK